MVVLKDKIQKYSKENGLPIGKWAKGDCYAVTCGLIRLKKYCAYFIRG